MQPQEHSVRLQCGLGRNGMVILIVTPPEPAAIGPDTPFKLGLAPLDAIAVATQILATAHQLALHPIPPPVDVSPAELHQARETLVHHRGASAAPPSTAAQTGSL